MWDDESTGVDIGDATVRQAWQFLAEEWASEGFDSPTVLTVVTVGAVVLALGLIAAVWLRVWARRLHDEADARPVDPGRREATFQPGRFKVGPVAPESPRRPGAVYAPGSVDETVLLRPGPPPASGRPRRWDPDTTIEFRQQPR
ncbi:hypothetical protein I0C86_41685 [Plantactinospora sp. S1510]|uniref:Uncharacterized protein n=1 Tax=Plantactinospora alkalitolerans TaxID=2789879 RepID=A0ABS0HA56_9ACTN|nr:hypothetical protein [Plantactinospora alkalitolerans]MBF9135366.1 hypothetical protein [Plantactinospora alkalitolerans]